MNAFLSVLEKHDLKCEDALRRNRLTTLQVNMGNLCNQSCRHCHIEASPQGKNIMPKKVVGDILRFLAKYKIKTLDITGGAPELNPNFDYFIIKARPLIDEIIVRSNLTVFFEPGREYLPQFFKKNRIHLIGSLPCYSKDKVDYQRGVGAFEKSIKALRLLNKIGFSKKKDLVLDLVYNPTGAYLPPEQALLEREYKDRLNKNFGINFSRLITITNAPIKRFRNYLESRGEYNEYFDLLKDNFNPAVLENIMCRTFLSIGFDGKLYDCDFNQALGLALKDKKSNILTIDRLDPNDLEGEEIIIDGHCLSCTAGSGSSCQGALSDKKETVKEYYGKVLKGTKDLKTSACCAIDSMPKAEKNILKKIEPEILDKFYGCGSPMPPLLEGCTVLDLGCGTGRDTYVASYLVGEKGWLIGIDMTDEQIEVAEKFKDKQMKKFGFKKQNIEFKKGYIEDLKSIGIRDNSVDVVISNCVINLSPDKEKVFSEIFRVLKPGGELYFSDVFSGSRIPKHLEDDPVIYGECLGGALYIEDFRRILGNIGCPDYRVISKRKIEISNPEIRDKVGMIDFYSMTIRAFKLDDLEDICEDYGQIALYLGTVPAHKHRFMLDGQHIFIAKKPMLVCGNTASMLSKTRYAKHFKVVGNKVNHFGPFNCAPTSAKIKEDGLSSLGGACC